MVEEIYLRFPARLDYLHLATMLARHICGMIKSRAGDDDFHYDIPLCISEACSNAIKYGSPGDGTISLSFVLHEDRLVIRVGDHGDGFDLAEITDPDFDAHPESGYGIFIIRAKMDHVEYLCGREENHLVMIKHLDSGEDERQE